MMRSLFTGVSGLRVHQTKMDIIANNISNVNTAGYKASRVTFNEVFYQRLAGASAANANTGRAGVNPTQIGLGVSVASIDNLMTQGTPQRTDKPLDLMIQGSGFFIVGDNSGTYFTRAGNFILDHQNTLSMNGMALMGWDTVKDPATGEYVISSGSVNPITITGEKAYVQPEPTSIVSLQGNLNANDDSVVKRTMEFFDTVGNLYTADVVLTYHPSDGSAGTPASDLNNSYWNFEFITDINGKVQVYPDNDRKRGKAIDISVGPFGGTTGTGGTGGTTGTNVNVGLLRFNNQGILQGAYPSNATAADLAVATEPRINLTLTVKDEVLDPTALFGLTPVMPGSATPPEGVGLITLDLSELTQFAGKTTDAKCLYVDGDRPGTLEDLSVGPDGKITGRYSNGSTKLLGQVPLATFMNPAGLEKVGNNLYVTTPNSGPFDGVGQTGDIMGGVLEMANVDLSSEFTEMITTQRGYQANSRIITVSDDMLQELVNLKR